MVRLPLEPQRFFREQYGLKWFCHPLGGSFRLDGRGLPCIASLLHGAEKGRLARHPLGRPNLSERKRARGWQGPLGRTLFHPQRLRRLGHSGAIKRGE